MAGDTMNISHHVWSIAMRGLADDDRATRARAFLHLLAAAPAEWSPDVEVPDEAPAGPVAQPTISPVRREAS